MAAELFAGEQHAESYAKYRPQSAPEVAELAMAYLKQGKQESKDTFDFLVDIGCGNGQSTSMFAPYFSKILGIDPSENQIKYAQANNSDSKITYQVGAAEDIPVPDHSVDLIAAGEAIHWVEFEKFFEECKRVLKPDGCIVLHGYNMPRLSISDDEDATADSLSQEFFNSCIWNERVKHVIDGYKEIFELVPTKNKERNAHVTDLVRKTTLLGALQYFQTWSGYQEYKKQKGDSDQEDISSVLSRKLKKHWNVESKNDDEIKITIKYPVFMILSKRP